MHEETREEIKMEKTIREFFRFSIWLKGASAALETIGGGLALFISPQAVAQIGFLLTQDELAEDPNDFIASHVFAISQSVAGSSATFAALYLLSHGVVKLALVVGLLKDKIWAYPTSLSIFGLFTLYQGYLWYFNQSVYLAALTAFDIVVMWLIWREWRIIRAHLAASAV